MSQDKTLPPLPVSAWPGVRLRAVVLPEDAYSKDQMHAYARAAVTAQAAHTKHEDDVLFDCGKAAGRQEIAAHLERTGQSVTNDAAPAEGWLMRPVTENAMRRMIDLCNKEDASRWQLGFRAVAHEVLGPVQAPWEIADIVDKVKALVATPPEAATAERTPWLTYLSDRADGVRGHYAIARWNPKGYREVWNLRRHEWSSFSDEVLTLEEANSLLEKMTVPTATAEAADVEALRHSANEWADMATNGLQWIRNIVDGASDAKTALDNMVKNLEHCRAVNDAPGVQRIVARSTAEAAGKAPASVPSEPPPHPGQFTKWTPAEADAIRRWGVTLALGAMPLKPEDHDELPPLGSKVEIHLASTDSWVEHTVVGYYVWTGSAAYGGTAWRVFVRVMDANGYLNARDLSSVRRAALAAQPRSTT